MTYGLPAYNEANWHTKLNASMEALRQIVVHYDEDGGVWPARPTPDAGMTVIWVGGAPSSPPTEGLTGVDLWYVPQLL